MGLRGQLTKEIQDLSKKIIKRNISQKELRLMPYIQYQILNGGKVTPESLSDEEFNIIDKWVNEKFYITDDTGLSCMVTKPFWDFMNEILWLGYAGK